MRRRMSSPHRFEPMATALEMGQEAIEDDTLLTLTELSVELRRRRIISRSKRSLFRYADGVDCCGRVIFLKTVVVSNVRHSTVGWFKQFIDSMNEAG